MSATLQHQCTENMAAAQQLTVIRTMTLGLPHDNVQMSRVHITKTLGMNILMILKNKLLRIVVMCQYACRGMALLLLLGATAVLQDECV